MKKIVYTSSNAIHLKSPVSKPETFNSDLDKFYSLCFCISGPYSGHQFIHSVASSHDSSLFQFFFLSLSIFISTNCMHHISFFFQMEMFDIPFKFSPDDL